MNAAELTANATKIILSVSRQVSPELAQALHHAAELIVLMEYEAHQEGEETGRRKEANRHYVAAMVRS